MTHFIDHALVAILVVFSFIVVLYSLSSARTKRWLLSLVARYFGLRIMLLVMPKQSGCNGCSDAGRHSTLASDLKKLKSKA